MGAPMKLRRVVLQEEPHQRQHWRGMDLKKRRDFVSVDSFHITNKWPVSSKQKHNHKMVALK